MSVTPPEAPTIVVGDSRELGSHLAALAKSVKADADEFLTLTITSPPYGALIDYGVPGQIGFGETHEDYLAACEQIFAELFRRTKNDGSLWIVVDSFLAKSRDGGEVKSMVPLPFVLSGLAERAGWKLREVVIWHKDRTRPWTHHGKLRNSFEYVLLLVKSNDFKFHHSRLRESQDLASWWVRYPERYNVFGKVPDNVWHVPIPPQGTWGSKAYQHACPLPPELVRRMVLLSSDPGDVVFDPFAGIGTVPAVADALDRRGVGVELNDRFASVFQSHVRSEVREQFRESAASGSGPGPETIANLRMLKFSKVLFSKLRETLHAAPDPRVILAEIEEVVIDDRKGSPVGQVSYTFAYDDLAELDRVELEIASAKLIRTPPLSKYGIEADVRFLSISGLRKPGGVDNFYVYEHGVTWKASRAIGWEEVSEMLPSTKRGRFVSIISNREVRVDADLIGDVASTDWSR